VSEKEKVLVFLRNAGGFATRSAISIEVFQRHLTADELDTLLSTVLNGFVEVKEKKWKLTPLGWNLANQIGAPEATPVQPETISSDFARFKTLAKENPDCSAQRLLQLAGRHLGDPLEDSEQWRSFRAENPEWYLLQPREWYRSDVALDESGYPLRYPTDPLTAKEREVRPATERGWFERTMRQTGASLEPFAVEMPGFECANILRVVKKIGQQLAEEIFGPTKIATARRLVGVTVNS